MRAPHFILNTASVPILVEIGLVLLLASFSADLIWTVFDKPVRMASAPISDTEAPQQNYDALTRFDPFHRATIAPTAESVAAEALPETTLDLKLLGVRSSADGLSSAIIRTPDGKQRSYGEGGDILANVSLAHVLVDRVIVNRAGRRETLLLQDRKGKRSSARQLIKPATPVNTVMVGTKLLEEIAMEPRLVGGRMDGFILRPRGDGGLFADFGLQAGDVLLAINGEKLDSAERAAAIANTLRTARDATLDLERNGARHSLRLSLDGAS